VPSVSVTAFLEQQHGVKIAAGGKGLCPFCRRDTFAVRKDDSLGKCFHPACGKFISKGSLADGYAGSLYQILDTIKLTCHEHLLKQRKPGNGHTYEFLVNERHIHPDVIRDLTELGAAPPAFDVAATFQPAFETLQAREADVKAKLDASLARRLDAKAQRQQDHAQGKQNQTPTAKNKTEQEKGWEKELVKFADQRTFLEEQLATLRERFGNAVGWLVFFHTDPLHRVRSIRFRKPYDKRFQSYQPSKQSGLFGHALFKPYVSEEKQKLNRLMLVEGEFILLQIQSLAVRTAQPGAAGSGYANWIAATGSASTIDIAAIETLLATPGAVRRPILIQDNDEAGDAMVQRLAEKLTVEIVTPPARGQDVDDFIRGFGTEYAQAALQTRRLVEERQIVYRPFAAVAEQIFELRQKHGEEDVRREYEIHNQVQSVLLSDLAERGEFYHEGSGGFFFFDPERKLIALDDSDKELSILLSQYGLNATEKVFEFMAEALHVHSLTEGRPTRVHRFCWFNAKSFTLYLFNHANSIYRITAEAVEMVDNGTDGVLFLHNRRHEPFTWREDQEPGDGFHELIASEIKFEAGRLSVVEQQAIFTLWFLSTFFGSLLPTRPLLALIGPKGSGKSHILRKVGILLFGAQFEVKSLPDKEDSFDAITTNSHFAAFDNADSRVAWLPDRLAICATGGTVSKRVLYTTNQLADFPINCFVGITSRTPNFRRDDVADRLLIHRLHRIEDGQFVSEHELLAAVLASRDRIMTDVMRQLQEAIRALQATAEKSYKTYFRMADFATFALRLADADGAQARLEEVLLRLGEEQAAFTLEGDSLVELLEHWLARSANERRWVDAATLFRELSILAAAKNLCFNYKSGRALAQRLANTEHNLRTVIGVEAELEPHLKQKVYRFWKRLESGPNGPIVTRVTRDSAAIPPNANPCGIAS
jgi:hypothetical protein